MSEPMADWDTACRTAPSWLQEMVLNIQARLQEAKLRGQSEEMKRCGDLVAEEIRTHEGNPEAVRGLIRVARRIVGLSPEAEVVQPVSEIKSTS